MRKEKSRATDSRAAVIFLLVSLLVYGVLYLVNTKMSAPSVYALPQQSTVPINQEPSEPVNVVKEVPPELVGTLPVEPDPVKDLPPELAGTVPLEPDPVKEVPSAPKEADPVKLSEVEVSPVEANKGGGKYQANWGSLDTRPTPSWYPEGKLGIFLHWGLFSVPSLGAAAEQFWGNWKQPGDLPKQVEKRNYMEKYYPPDFKFQDFAPEFKAELYDPEHWAQLFQNAGAKYVVLTSKHHDGYVMWPSKNAWNWNANDTGPGRDLVGALQQAVTKTGVHFGLYVSLMEWYHPMYKEDQENGFKTQTFVDHKLMPELKDMVNLYKPEVIFADGDWAPGDFNYWKSPEFLAWLFNESPVRDTVVVNDRWGMSNCWCKHGSYFTCGDHSNFGVLQPYIWENAMTIDKSSWGYRRDSNLERYNTIEQLLKEFITTISCGGNMLMNVGPTSSGTIPPIYEERLRQMGKWLRVNGEAVYSSTAWKGAQNDSLTGDIWYTAKGPAVYAFYQDWPANDKIILGSPKPGTDTRVTLLGYNGGQFEWSQRNEGGMTITIPKISIKKLPCLWAWTLKLENLRN